MNYQTINQRMQSLLQSTTISKQGVFFNGQIFDAYQFVSDLIRSAKKSIIIVDNYSDDSVLKQLTKRKPGVSVMVCVNHISDALKLDIARHNSQYPAVEVCEVSAIHDRFLLLDDIHLYTFGASFKDLGKKLFCFSLIECESIVKALKEVIGMAPMYFE